MNMMYNFNQDPYSAMQKQLDQMRTQAPAIPNSNLIWVQGIEGAKGYHDRLQKVTLCLHCIL